MGQLGKAPHVAFPEELVDEIGDPWLDERRIAEGLILVLHLLAPSMRLRVFAAFCRSCGREDPLCPCGSDR